MSDLCEHCGHANGPHILSATLYAIVQCEGGPKEIPAGGHTYCPVPGCECHGTWSIQDEVAGFDVCKRIAEQGEPDREAVRRIRGH